MNPNKLRVERTKSIDQLYRSVKDYDLVLTVDAPLADALNARLEEAILGHFATTPRGLALDELSSSKEPLEQKSELFLKVIEETDLGWKRTTYLLENVLNCWKETGDAHNILKFDRFDDEETKKVIQVLKSTLNQYSAIERYTVPNNVDLAVVGKHQFTALDKKILPKRYDKIEPFTGEETALPPFNIFNSTTEMIETIMDNLKQLDPKDVAVVMEKGSEYRYLVESLFRSNEIPYMVSEDITEIESLRDFLNLIRASFFKGSLKVKDVKSFMQDTSEVDPKADEYYIETYQNEDLEKINELLEKIPKLTFKELLENSLFKNELEELKKHLEQLDLLNKNITLERLNSLTYYLETFEITKERASRGVLIASPDSSTFIDRPVVFYLGLDSSWTPEVPSRPWIDEKRFDEREIKNFKILLQNGEERHFMVKDREFAEEITPSFYFNEFTERNIESFRDLKHELRRKELEKEKRAFKKEDIKTKTKQAETMSQSTLNTFAYCPKDHFFSRLVKTPDKVYFRRGTLLHEFGEFYLNYPEVVENEREKILDKMVEELSHFLNETQRASARTRFKLGIKNMISYLDSYEDFLDGPAGYVKRYRDNTFAELFDKDITIDFTEVSFHDEDIGAKGKVDLVVDHDKIVDHKTGNKKSISKIMELSDIDEIDEKPNFQAKMYLAHHRNHHPDTPIEFTYFHLLNNIGDVISGKGGLEDNSVDVQYHNEEFNDLVHEEEMFEWLKSSNRRKKVLNKLGYDDYRSFFEDRTIPDLEKEELLEHPITAEFISCSKEKIGDHKYVEKGCRGILKQLLYFREENYFRSDIDEFEIFLQEQIEKFNEYRRTDFPVGDIDPDEIENKDLVIV